MDCFKIKESLEIKGFLYLYNLFITKRSYYCEIFQDRARASSRKLGQHPILPKKGTLFEKREHRNFTTPYSIPFLNVLHQNKALHIFHKRGQHLIARCIKGLD